MFRIHRFTYAAIRKLFMTSIVFLIVFLCGCSTGKEKETAVLAYRYASKEEGRSLLLENEEYYKGLYLQIHCVHYIETKTGDKPLNSALRYKGKLCFMIALLSGERIGKTI